MPNGERRYRREYDYDDYYDRRDERYQERRDRRPPLPGKKSMVPVIAVIVVVFIVVAAMAYLFVFSTNEEEEKKTTRTLKVTVNYTGSGTVNSSHQITIAVFDKADFRGEQPEYYDNLSTSNGTAIISKIPFSPCYVFALYDADGSGSEPTSGDSYKVFENKDLSQLPADPINIAKGGTGNISISFDDSIKVNW